MCDVCQKVETTNQELLLQCRACLFYVHRECYDQKIELNKRFDATNWLCERCSRYKIQKMLLDSLSCCMCPENKGIMKSMFGYKEK